MTELSVNLNKIALLRNQRDVGIPSVIESAETIIAAGAHGITVHPRPDERHTKYADVYELAELLKNHPNVEFNIEGNPFTGKYMQIVPEVRPTQATLVPDQPGANTSDHGWDLSANAERLKPIIEKLNNAGARVSLFVDAQAPDLDVAKKIGADRVELYTEPYATAFRMQKNLDKTLDHYVRAAQTAKTSGLELNAGHDLNLKNLIKFCRTVPGIFEVSIGHALIAEALFMGLHKTVKEYLKLLSETE